MKMTTRCADCGAEIDPTTDPAGGRRPCPACSSTSRISFGEARCSTKFNAYIFARQKRPWPDRRSFSYEAQFGRQRTVATGRWARKWRAIDREQDHYEEFVVDPDTGKVLALSYMPLSAHRGHGSAKSRSDG